MYTNHSSSNPYTVSADCVDFTEGAQVLLLHNDLTDIHVTVLPGIIEYSPPDLRLERGEYIDVCL